MNTKEAIEILSHKEMAKFTDHEGLSYREYVEYKKYREKIDKVIELLKRDEKFEKMFRDMVDYFASPDDFVVKEITKKYFPKE